mmetsp:Transcript_17512/g.20215  ORF Transcript_17512/g.20215 Transcript_17512/m.20215 type:complete len:135 (+) Transcript_17512:69-473(+)
MPVIISFFVFIFVAIRCYHRHPRFVVHQCAVWTGSFTPLVVAATEMVQKADDNDKIEDILSDGELYSVIVRVPVTQGALESVGPVYAPEQQRPVVVVDGDITECVEQSAHKGPVPEPGGTNARTRITVTRRHRV